jgi:hypothetical protein
LQYFGFLFNFSPTVSVVLERQQEVPEVGIGQG